VSDTGSRRQPDHDPPVADDEQRPHRQQRLHERFGERPTSRRTTRSRGSTATS